MPYGHPFPRSMRRELFDLVCAGTSVRQAEPARRRVTDNRFGVVA